MLQIRRATPEDLAAVAAMHQALYDVLIHTYGYPFDYDSEEAAAALAVQLKSRFFGVFLAEEDGQAVGFAQCSVCKLERGITYRGDKSIGRLDNIFVAEHRRGGGIGRALMAEVKGWLAEQEVALVESYIVSANAPSLAFHERAGFVPICFRAACPLGE